jgi:hypothetical protein
MLSSIPQTSDLSLNSFTILICPLFQATIRQCASRRPKGAKREASPALCKPRPTDLRLLLSPVSCLLSPEFRISDLAYCIDNAFGLKCRSGAKKLMSRVLASASAPARPTCR